MSQANQPKFCADCQHLRVAKVGHNQFALCGEPSRPRNPVTGDPASLCDSERSEGRINTSCGPTGQLFQPRDPATYVSWVKRSSPLHCDTATR